MQSVVISFKLTATVSIFFLFKYFYLNIVFYIQYDNSEYLWGNIMQIIRVLASLLIILVIILY